MTPSSDAQPVDEPQIPGAARPPTTEATLAGGRGDDTLAPSSVWGFPAIAVPAALAVLIALLECVRT